MADEQAVPFIRTLRKIVLVFFVAIIAVVALVFVIDFAVFRIRVATGKAPFGTVVVRHYYAVGEKGNKTEYIFQPPQDEQCVNSLFPHAGDQPCWYLKKHPEQRTDI